MVDDQVNTGVDFSTELTTFASAVLGTDINALNAARQNLADKMGAGAVVSASIIAGVFSLLDRAANGIGINVEPMVLNPSEDFRAELGINAFPSAVNTLGSRT